MTTEKLTMEDRFMRWLSERDGFWNWFWRIHPRIFKKTKGRVMGKMMGMPVIMFTTTGRKSGLPREKTITCFQRNSSFALVASNLGRPEHAQWYLNLQADPNATVLYKGDTFPVVARFAEGEERDEIWDIAVEAVPQYDYYAEKTEGIREIPVVVFDRV